MKQPQVKPPLNNDKLDELIEDHKKYLRVKVFHMHEGLDLIGSTKSIMSSDRAILWLLPYGVKMYSKKTGRIIIVPFSNIRGLELLNE